MDERDLDLAVTVGSPLDERQPAWRTVPSWYLIAGRDNAIGTNLERFMAKRIPHVTAIEVKGDSCGSKSEFV